MKRIFFFLLFTLPTFLFGQSEQKKLFIELTYGYELSTKNNYKRKLTYIGVTRTTNIIQDIRLGVNIGYPIHPRFNLLSGVKANINTTPLSGAEEQTLFTRIFLTRKNQRDFYVAFPLRGRILYNY